MIRKVRKLLSIIVWLLFVFWISLSIYLYFIWFDIKTYLLTLKISREYLVLIILILFLVRPYLFIPWALITVASWFIFQNFYLTLSVSLIWVSLGFIQTYSIWYLFREDLKNFRFIKNLEKYNKEIKKKWWKAIFLASLFPAFPTDIMCYSAGFVRYNFFKYFIFSLFPQIFTLALYSYLWVQAEKYFNHFLYIILLFLAVWLFYKYFRKHYH